MRSAFGGRLRERQHVPRNRRASSDNGMRADAHEMVHRTQRADAGPVFDGDMSTERGGVGHDNVAADLAIVSDVSVGHNQVVAPNLGETAPLHRTSIDGDELANLVVV